MELTPDGYRALDAMWRSANASGTAVDDMALRTAAAAVAAAPAV